MEIKFSNWKSIDLQALDTGITSALSVFDTIYNSFDATNFFVDTVTVTNTRVTGTSGIYDVVVLGSNFTNLSVPFETYNSISLINSTNTAEQLLTTGSVTYNYITDSYTGFYNKISYVSNNTGGLTNLLIEGRFNVDVFGDTIGGTASKYNVTFNGNTINLVGNMILNANDDIVGGTISAFTFTDNLGRTFTANGLSISATEFYRLTDPNPPNSFLTLDAFYNYLTDASRLAGNDVITANATDTQSDTLNGYGGNDTLGGGGGNDVLNGGLGVDILDGGTGADAMNGGDGNDTYFVDDADDNVTEDNANAAVGGIDRVNSSLNSYTLTANVENLTLTGTGNINGTGNALNNVITGNSGNNELNGEAGNDTLLGGDGADTLTGGAGVDALTGGKGNDTYNIDLIRTSALATSTVALQDTVSELANAVGSTVEGIDTINLINSTGNAGAATDFSNISTVTTLTVNAGIENFNASGTGNLKLNITGNTLDNVVTGNDADNVLLDSTGNDTLNGGAGNDSLDGGLGVDTLNGGTGNDTYLVDIIATTTGTAPAPIIVTGAQLQDVIIENAGEGTADTLRLRGSVVIPALTAAQDIVLAGALANIENLDISATGTTKLNISGNNADNILTGNAANNTLTGGFGNDRLDGGLGADSMDGGAGDDTYVIDNLLDVITPDSSGTDTAEIRLTAGTYTLSAGSGIENVILAGVSAINATGDTGANSLTGNAAANILNGGGGTDTMSGGLGNDTYFIDNLGDIVTENINEGTDTVIVSIPYAGSLTSSYTLGNNIENLTLNNEIYTAGSQLTGIGNSLNNIILGDGNTNILVGLDGNDTLDGGTGTLTDYLFGGAGNDTMNGRDGDDTYYIEGSSQHIVAEINDTAGNDTVLFNSTIENDTLKLFSGDKGIEFVYLGKYGTNINDGTLQFALINSPDVSNINVDASLLSNKLEMYGSEGDNSLVGTAYNDTIYGFNGNDKLFGGAGNDVIWGGDGNNTLNGGAGIDTLRGNFGDDTYVVDVAGNSITGLGGDAIFDFGGNDTVVTNFTASLTSLQFNNAQFNIENLTLLGTAALNATGDAGDNILKGNDGANTLDGGTGADDMDGGKGNDTYIVDDLGDDVSELFTAAQGGGIDFVKSSVSFELDDNIENLTLTNGTANGGTANIDGTGNELANTIIGNAGANVIDGDDGADRMTGGDGNDTYFVDNIGDIVTETNAISAIGGIDKVNSEISYVLGANLENLTLTGDDDINGTGNTLANTIIGNSGDNVLDGGASTTIVDSLTGGAGNDTYVVDLTVTGVGDATSFAIQDTFTESVGQGTDTLRLRGSLGYITARTLFVNDYAAQSIEGLDVSLTGSSKINITGNTEDNILIGNAFTNTLIGDAGNDILNGGGGADTMNGGAGDDTYFVDVIKPTVGSGGDVIIEDNIALNFGNDTVKTTYSADLNSTQFDGIENLTLLTGALNANGDAGNNELIGNASANTIKGEAGNDEITGGAGNDILTGGLGADTFVWELADKGANGLPAIDRITDFNIVEDKLDLRDLLVGESAGNILNFLDVTTSLTAGVTNTEIRISNTGAFAGGTFAASAENQHITLVGVNLFNETSTSTEEALLINLFTNNKLIIDV